MALKTYGENYYKGFVLLKNNKNNRITKHYISGVSGFLKKDAVKLYVRNASGDSCFDYKMGSNKKVDIGIKTWVAERIKKRKRVSDSLPDSCFEYAKRTKRKVQ